MRAGAIKAGSYFSFFMQYSPYARGRNVAKSATFQSAKVLPVCARAQWQTDWKNWNNSRATSTLQRRKQILSSIPEQSSGMRDFDTAAPETPFHAQAALF